ncbi:hypothetical protein Ciccas_010347 [Cichlidogyrus casuarinus]|uniref:Uncharacterized protein n=1 Tax=Cichlidogyrus casuarinus TaxID=1844966 RepID=A0ABD2PW02_9PLAT
MTNQLTNEQEYAEHMNICLQLICEDMLKESMTDDCSIRLNTVLGTFPKEHLVVNVKWPADKLFNMNTFSNKCRGNFLLKFDHITAVFPYRRDVYMITSTIRNLSKQTCYRAVTGTSKVNNMNGIYFFSGRYNGSKSLKEGKMNFEYTRDKLALMKITSTKKIREPLTRTADLDIYTERTEETILEDGARCNVLLQCEKKGLHHVFINGACCFYNVAWQKPEDPHVPSQLENIGIHTALLR